MRSPLRTLVCMSFPFLLPLVAEAQPPGGPGGPFGGPGPGGMMGQTRKILKDHDKNNDGWLNAEERKAAREGLKQTGFGGRRPGGFGPGPGGFGRGFQNPPKAGAPVKPEDATSYPKAPLYDASVLRTLFLEFEDKNWETELEEFHRTDVDVAATLIVDGKRYPNVGVHFRGMSSYGGVPTGFKRSLNISMDLADSKQRLYGYKTLNLLNSHEDPTFLSSVLYSHISRQYMPAPKANLVKVVINGENWGIYANQEQFDKVFLKENFTTEKGTRWKVRGNPGARGGLEYLGDDIEPYRARFEIKSADNDKAWKALINLCKVINQTPADKLEAALRPIMDIDGLLWFLAVDVALINGDGYWVRSSDYSLYLDPSGKFHVIPSDMNEAFRPAMGPGMGGFRMPFVAPGELVPAFMQELLRLSAEQKAQVAELQKSVDAQLEKILTEEQRRQFKEMRERGPRGFGPPGGGPGGFGLPGGGPGGFGAPGGGRGVELDPLVGLNSDRVPLRSKVLASPALRAMYLEHVRTIAEKSLDWKYLGPVVAQYRKLIEKEVEADTRKLESFEAFQRTTANEPSSGGGREMPLRAFADQRRKYLLDYKEPARPK